LAIEWRKLDQVAPSSGARRSTRGVKRRKCYTDELKAGAVGLVLDGKMRAQVAIECSRESPRRMCASASIGSGAAFGDYTRIVTRAFVEQMVKRLMGGPGRAQERGDKPAPALVRYSSYP
jgi:hypothetical protein